MSLEASMILQEENNNKIISSTVDHHPDGTARQVSYDRFYSLCLYPMQTMSEHGIIFPKVPTFEKTENPTSVIWVISALLTRVEKLWKAVCGTHMRTSKGRGWLLVYLHKLCFCSNNQRQVPKDPFKYLHMSTVDKLCMKMQDYVGVGDFFKDIPSVLCCDIMLKSFEEYMEENIGVSYDVIIRVNNNHRYDTFEPFLKIGDKEYECVTQVGVQCLEDDKWDGDIYSRHGGHYSGWWYDERYQTIPIQLLEYPEEPKPIDFDVLVYVIVAEAKVTEMRKKFMVNLGGQSHVLCKDHELPMIESTDRDRKCFCGRKEYYRCCEFQCKVVLCKKCLKNYDVDQTIPTLSTWIRWK